MTASAVDYVGPWEHHFVVVNGFRVPDLIAVPLSGGRINLMLDHRMAIELTVQEAERVVPFIADAMAVARGYTCHPLPGWDGPVLRQPMPRWISIDEMISRED